MQLTRPSASPSRWIEANKGARGKPVGNVAISVSGFLGPQALASGAASFLEKGSPLIDQLVQAVRAAVIDSGA